jgi:hypothetical protein
MKKLETELVLFDTEVNRQKLVCMSKLEIMADDSDNMEAAVRLFNQVDEFCEWGKKYKLTLEEIEDV